jgi:hypothetical protein
MNDGLLEVQGLGCGFLKLSKRCVKLLYENEKKHYNCDKGIVKNICECTVNENDDFVSEDIIIGFKWTNLGEKLYLDTTIKLTHVGNKTYTGNVAEWLNNWKKRLQPNENKDLFSEKLLKYFDQNSLENKKIDEDDTFKVL